MNSQVLKPCPFCSCTDIGEVTINSRHRRFKVYCKVCQCRTSEHKTRKEARIYWNTRTSDHIEHVRAMVVPDGWIAVSDRLPDETHAYGCHTNDVLCLTRARKHVIAMLAHTTTGAVWFDQQSQERDITHWMPLQTAPGDSK